MWPFERVALRRAREELLAPLRGRVLELGSGTGANFPFYQEPHLVTAVEPDHHMMQRALKSRPSGLMLEEGYAEEIPLADASVDHVVSTLVLCSVKDPVLALGEIRRVCKPNGRLHLIEHVRGRGVPGSLHDFFTPIWSKICAGCHLNRETMHLLRECGFQLEEEKVVFNFLGTPFVFSRLLVG